MHRPWWLLHSGRSARKRCTHAPEEGWGLLTIGDCEGLCGLTEDELQVLAEHKHLPLIVAAELGADLLRTPKGIWLLRSYLLAELEKAAAAGMNEKAKRLDRIIRGFISAHPIPTVL